MRKFVPLGAVVVVFLAWWFLGRNPHAEIQEPWNQELVYKIPRWYGWETRGVLYRPVVPPGYEDWGAKGWWYLKGISISEDELPNLDPEKPEAFLEALEPYVAWEPL